MTTLAQRSFFPHQPVGERVSHGVAHHDGRPANEWVRPNIAEFRQEMNDFWANRLDPQLTETEYDDFKALLSILRTKAEEGTVRLSGPLSDGKVIENTGFLIELRPILRRGTAFGRKLREVRLYLAEPSLYPRSLLGLHLATKEASDDGYAEQDVAIAEAVDRAYAWQER
ncbi:hypothetical protein [Curtobacterium sp. 1544]|uniref:hypothetical protein n=1 Tax=Curtobacterium sp. 1544 TaxID=3156417 RepID=UPI00339B087E